MDTKRYLGVIDKQLNEGKCKIHSLNIIDEEAERQKVIKDYMEEYNSHFRTQTLMEEH